MGTDVEGEGNVAQLGVFWYRFQLCVAFLEGLNIRIGGASG